MLIRKRFKFENAHILRGCSARRCSHAIHDRSDKIERLLKAHALDHGQMVYDFGLLKDDVRELIDAVKFSLAITRDWRDPVLFERLSRSGRALAAASLAANAPRAGDPIP